MATPQTEPARGSERAHAAVAAEAEPSVAEALQHVNEALRGFLEERIELLRLELQEAGERAARGGVLIAAAGVLALGTWFGLMAAAALFLAAWLGAAAGVAIVAAVNGLIAAGLAQSGARKLRAPLPPDSGGGA